MQLLHLQAHGIFLSPSRAETRSWGLEHTCHNACHLHIPQALLLPCLVAVPWEYLGGLGSVILYVAFTISDLTPTGMRLLQGVVVPFSPRPSTWSHSGRHRAPYPCRDINVVWVNKRRKPLLRKDNILSLVSVHWDSEHKVDLTKIPYVDQNEKSACHSVHRTKEAATPLCFGLNWKRLPLTPWGGRGAPWTQQQHSMRLPEAPTGSHHSKSPLIKLKRCHGVLAMSVPKHEQPKLQLLAVGAY